MTFITRLHNLDNGIYTHYLLAVLAVLAAQTKATSSEWEQSSNPIELAGQSMSLVSVPKQRSSSSHVRVVDEGWEKLKEEMHGYR